MPRRSYVWGSIATVVFVALLMLLPTGVVASASARGFAAGSSHSGVAAIQVAPASSTSFARHHGIVAVQLPGTFGIGFLASHGRTALVAYLLSDGSTEIARFDASTNSFLALQDLGGGFGTTPESMMWIGERYLFSIYNFTSFAASFETYSLSAGIQVVSVAVDLSQLWQVVGVGDGLVFLASPGHLLALDPQTLAVVNDFSALLPAGGGTFSVTTDGSDAYLGGDLQTSATTFEYLFGVLHLKAGSYTQLSPTVSLPPNTAELITSVVVQDDKVFFGGQQTTFSSGQFFSTGGLVLAYDPENHHFKDLSGTLPTNGAVEQLLSIGSTVGVVVDNFSISPSVYTVPGFFEVKSGLSGLLNLTSITGPQFAVFALESSVSGGLVFMGGADLVSGNTQLEYASVEYLASFAGDD